MATTGAQRAETRLTVKDVLDTASSAGLRMTAEKAEDYLVHHCVSLWYSMQACGREYVLECLKNAFREQNRMGEGKSENTHHSTREGNIAARLEDSTVAVVRRRRLSDFRVASERDAG